MKKNRFVVFVTVLAMLAGLTGCQANQFASQNTTPVEKHTIEVQGPVDGKIEGAASVEGKIDVQNSPYFTVPDYYNGDVSDTLILLKHFKTYQQTSERSCGAASIIMIANYLNGEVLSEDELDKEMDIRYYDNPREDGSYGASTASVIEALQKRGYTVTSSYDTADANGYSFHSEKEFADYLKQELSAGHPIMTENVEWAGHWMVIIGYDDMGTESYLDDVLVFADAYDTSDHCQDGYFTKNFEKYYAEWFDAGVMSKKESVQQYVTVQILS